MVVRAAEQKLFVLSLSKWESARENNQLKLRVSGPKIYYPCTFAPLHNLQRKTPNMLKEWAVPYLLPEHVVAHDRDRAGGRKAVLQKKKLLHDLNMLFPSIEEISGNARVMLNFSKKEMSFDLSGLFSNMGLRGVLEEGSLALSMLFPFFDYLIDRTTCFTEPVLMETVHETYLYLIRGSTEYRSHAETNGTRLKE